MKYFLSRFSTRSVVVLVLVSGTLYLAITDPAFRGVFADLAKVGVGGYLGQLVPREKE